MAQMHEASFAESRLASSFLANWPAAGEEEVKAARPTSQKRKTSWICRNTMDKEISVNFSGGGEGELQGTGCWEDESNFI